MILSIDFDGVLHPAVDDARQYSCAPILWELLRRHPVASAVFSTGWRFERPLEELRQLVCAGGGEDLMDRFIDVTPLLRHGTEEGSRGKDCRAWLQSHRPISPWLALDDMPSLFARNAGNLYQVNAKRGLMHYDVAQISARIQTVCE